MTSQFLRAHCESFESCKSCQDNRIAANAALLEAVGASDPRDLDASTLALRVVKATGLPEPIVRAAAKDLLAVIRTMNAAYRNNWEEADSRLDAGTKLLRRLSEGHYHQNIDQYLQRVITNERITAHRRSARIRYGSDLLERASADTPRLRTEARERTLRWLKDHNFPTLVARIQHSDKTQRQLAAILGVDPATVSRRLSAERNRLVLLEDEIDM